MRDSDIQHFISADRRAWFMQQDEARFIKAMERLVITEDGRLEKRVRPL